MSRKFDKEKVRKLFMEHRVLTLDELKSAMEKRGTMTVFRRLKELSYLSSYSHRGKFYTLKEIPQFDILGLWNWKNIHFSRYGNLLNTAKVLVDDSEAGYGALELEEILHIEVKHALLQLSREKHIRRKKIYGAYIYLSSDNGKRRNQVLLREQREEAFDIGFAEDIIVLPDELKAAIILFFSLLDEKQRRLYSGLEAAKLGYGGDRKIARLFGLDPHTVAKGRQELFGGSIDRQRIRTQGGGRTTAEKKLPK